MNQWILNKLFEGDNVHVIDEQLHLFVELSEGRRTDGLNISHNLLVLGRRKHLEFVSQLHFLGEGDFLLVFVVQSI